MLGVNKKNRIDLLTILVFLIVARLSCPGLSNIPFMSVGFIFIYGVLFCGLYLFSAKRLTQSELKILMVVLCYTVFVLVKIILSGGGIFSTDAFNAYIIFFMVVIYFWLKEQTDSLRANLLKLIFAGCIFNYAYSIIVLYFDPSASRISAASEVSPYDILSAIGGFDAVYGGIFVVLILLYMRNNIEKGGNRILINLVLILALIFIFMASYATAIIMLLLSVFIFISNKNKALSFIGIFAIVAMVFFHQAVGAFIMEMSKRITYSETISNKINEFGYMVKTLEAAGTYAGDEGRLKNMLDSLNTFLKYPIFGGLGEEGAIIGEHSEFCDVLGKYGLIAFSVITMFFVFLHKEIRKNITIKENVKCLNIVYFIFIILTVLNPALYTLIQLPIILMIFLSESYVRETANRTPKK